MAKKGLKRGAVQRGEQIDMGYGASASLGTPNRFNLVVGEVMPLQRSVGWVARGGMACPLGPHCHRAP